MYGWRARIGLLIAHSNTIMEPEFNRIAPEGVSIHAGRVRIEKITVEGLRDMNRNVERAVEDLSEIDAASFAYACTAASWVGSHDADRAMAKKIEDRTGRPAVTAAGSVLDGLRALGAKRISVATPYPEDVNVRVKAFIESQGFEVLGIGGQDLGRIAPLPPLAEGIASHPGLQPPYLAYKIGKKCFVKGSDALFVSAAGIRTVDVLGALEHDLGVPVVSSAQAIMWAALRAAGVNEPISGCGRLMTLPG